MPIETTEADECTCPSCMMISEASKTAEMQEEPEVAPVPDKTPTINRAAERILRWQ